MTAQESKFDPPEHSDITNLCWCYQPRRDSPGKVMFAGSVVFVTLLLITVVDPWLALVGGFLLLYSGAEGFFTSRFVLTEQGLHVFNGPRRVVRDWSQFSGYSACNDGFLLRSSSPIKFIRRQRSVLLRCSNNRDEVHTLIRRGLGGERQ